ncbi:hypothetical protein ACQCLI_32155 (plasmid) [Pseudomonas nitroreducens]|uniref:hypothetical protein n=1 Tax=Pseudomonas nitroreducens TaxID=46680 RepID=UPI000373D85E|nr:hypothetical protein [Pseudomonas nitroreducens]
MLKQGLALLISLIALHAYADGPTREMQKHCDAEGEVYAFYALARSTGVSKESSLEGLNSGNFTQDQVTLRKEAIASAYGEQNYANPTVIKRLAVDFCLRWQSEAAARGMNLDQTSGTLKTAIQSRAVAPSEYTKTLCDLKASRASMAAQGREKLVPADQWFRAIDAQSISDSQKVLMREGVIAAYETFPDLDPDALKQVINAKCLAENQINDENKALSQKQ